MFAKRSLFILSIYLLPRQNNREKGILMNNIESNTKPENEYVSIPEAVKITQADYHYIYGLYQRKRIRSDKLPNGKPAVHIIDLKRYLLSHPPITKDVVWDNISPLDGEKFFPITGYDFRYFATDKGRIVNVTTGEELINTPRESDGYIQLTIMKNGTEKSEYLHRLILAACCPLKLDKKYSSTAELLEDTRYKVHHIHIGKSGKLRNTPNDLLLTDDSIKYYEDGQEYTQHQKLHKLWDEGKKKEYWQMVRDIKKSNERELFKIPHPDFESDEHFSYFLWVDTKGKKAFDKGKEIPITSVFKESVEMNEKVGENS